MTLRAADVVPLLPDPATRPATPTDRSLRPRAPLSRRAFLSRAALATCAAVSVQVLGVFPPARKALADGYDTWTSSTTGPCGSTGYAVNHNCSPGCGPSSVCGGTTNGPCCSSGGWHKGSGGYRLRPNQCYRSYYDAWHWRCSTTGAMYRCHDGWTYTAKGYVRTICRHVV
jgi:hypothetical protein